jgi:hypothetical protein
MPSAEAKVRGPTPRNASPDDRQPKHQRALQTPIIMPCTTPLLSKHNKLPTPYTHNPPLPHRAPRPACTGRRSSSWGCWPWLVWRWPQQPGWRKPRYVCDGWSGRLPLCVDSVACVFCASLPLLPLFLLCLGRPAATQGDFGCSPFPYPCPRSHFRSLPPSLPFSSPRPPSKRPRSWPPSTSGLPRTASFP